jgi:hypothetical protein
MPLSPHTTPSHVHSLVHTHLQVFSEPSRSLRTPLYDTIYSPDITLYRSDGGVVRGIEGVDAEIESLVGEGKSMNGWKFVVPGEMKLNADFVWVAWGFGPRVEGVIDVKVSFVFFGSLVGILLRWHAGNWSGRDFAGEDW